MARNDAETLLKKAMDGDRAALVDLLEQVGPQVRARIAPKVSGHLQTSVDVDDLMQVTYIEAVTRLDHFKGGGASGFLAWLTRLAENNLIDAVRALEAARRPDPHKRVSIARNSEQSMIALVEVLGITTTTPSRHAAMGEGLRALNVALSQLPPDYEKVVRMYDLEGRPVEEVASEMGRTQGAVYMLRARAHERLKELMGPAAKFFSTPG